MTTDVGSLQQLAVDWLPVLLDSAGKGMVLLLAAGVLVLVMRKASAAARQMVWLLALAALLTLPLVSAALPSWQVLPGWARIEMPSEPSASPLTISAGSTEISPPTGPLGGADLAEVHGSGMATSAMPDTDVSPMESGQELQGADDLATNSPDEPVAQRADEPDAYAASEAHANAPPPFHAADAAVPTEAASKPQRPLFAPVAMAVWLTGTLVCLLPLLLGRIGLLRLARNSRPIDDNSWTVLFQRAAKAVGLRRRVAMLQSDSEPMPMVWGILTPKLLLPSESADWSADRRWVVLLHELAHAKRRDCLAKLIAHVACAAYWFNPLAWAAFKLMQREAEAACDDLVLSNQNAAPDLASVRPSDYAQHLLEIASGLKSGMLDSYSSIAMARKSNLEGRLLAILDSQRNRRGLSMLLTMLLIAAVVAIVIPLSTLRAKDGEFQSQSATAKVGESTRKFPAFVVFINNHRYGPTNGGSLIPQEGVEPPKTGKSIDGHPGAVSEVEWKYLRTTDAGDEYEVTRRFPVDAPTPGVETKTVVYSGKPLTVFQDNVQRVLFLSQENFRKIQQSEAGAAVPSEAGGGIYVVAKQSRPPTTQPIVGDTSGMDAKINQLFGKALAVRNVRRILGKPLGLYWGSHIHDGNFPFYYIMSYPGGVGVGISEDVAIEIRSELPGPGFTYRGLHLGSSLEDVLATVGQPEEVVVGKPLRFVNGTLYKDADGAKGLSYYSRSEYDVRFFFVDDKVVAMYVTLPKGVVLADRSHGGTMPDPEFTPGEPGKLVPGAHRGRDYWPQKVTWIDRAEQMRGLVHPKAKVGRIDRGDKPPFFIAIDANSQDAQEPDLLRLDTSGNGDFTAAPFVKLTGGQGSYYAPEQAINVVIDGRPTPLKIEVRYRRWPDRSMRLTLNTAANSTCEFGGALYRVRLHDRTGDYRYGQLPRFEDGRLIPGDSVQITSTNMGFAGVREQQLGQPVHVGGKWYDLTIDGEAMTVSAKPVAAPIDAPATQPKPTVASTRPADPAATAPSVGKAGSRLDIRMAPTWMGDQPIDEYLQLLNQGKIGQWWLKEKDWAGRMPGCIWLPLRGDPPNHSDLVVGKYQGKWHLLVVNVDEYGRTMPSPASGGPAWGLSRVFKEHDAMGRPTIVVQFDKPGTELFRSVTSSIWAKVVAIIVDDEVVSTQVIQQPVGDRTVITGQFTEQEADNLVRALKGGMPAASPSAAEVTVKPATQPGPRSTPLHEAAAGGHGETAEMLIAQGLGVNMRDEQGRTALHLAALNGHQDTAWRLLKRGADLNACDDQGQTPLSLAAARGHKGLAQFLIEHGATLPPKTSQPAPAIKPATKPAQAAKNPTCTLTATIYELRLPEVNVKELNADSFALAAGSPSEFEKALADAGQAKLLYRMDQSANLAGDRLKVTQKVPVMTSSRSTDKGGQIRKYVNKSVGAVLDITGTPAAEGIDVALGLEVTTLADTQTEATSQGASSPLRQVKMAFKGLARPDKAIVVIGADSASPTADGMVVVYVARIVLGEAHAASIAAATDNWSCPLEATIYEVHVAPESNGSLSAARLTEAAAAGPTGLDSALSQIGEAKVLYRMDQSIKLAGDRIMIRSRVPFITDTRQTASGQPLNTVQYQDVGATLNIAGEMQGDGGVLAALGLEITALNDSPVEMSPKILAPVLRAIALGHKGTMRPGCPIVIVSVDAGSLDANGKAVAYVARVVLGNPSAAPATRSATQLAPLVTRTYQVAELVSSLPDEGIPPLWMPAQTKMKDPAEKLRESQEKKAADLIEAVQDAVEPGSWRAKGGPGQLNLINGQLSVTQTAPNHEKLLGFIAHLLTERSPQISVQAKFITVPSRDDGELVSWIGKSFDIRRGLALGGIKRACHLLL